MVSSKALIGVAAAALAAGLMFGSVGTLAIGHIAAVVGPRFSAASQLGSGAPWCDAQGQRPDVGGRMGQGGFGRTAPGARGGVAPGGRGGMDIGTREDMRERMWQRFGGQVPTDAPVPFRGAP